MINVIHQFTYKNYIQCIHNIRQKDYIDLQEESEKYSIFIENDLDTRFKSYR